MSTWKPTQSILKARNLAHLISYLEDNDTRLASQPQLCNAARVNEALFALDPVAREPANMARLALPLGRISYANGARFGSHLLVLKYPEHKLAVFIAVVERRASGTTTQHLPEHFLQLPDSTMGMIPSVFSNSAEVAQVARNTVRVHMGFSSAYEEIQQAVAIQVQRCLQNDRITKFACVGHSFGGALATLMSVHVNVIARQYATSLAVASTPAASTPAAAPVPTPAAASAAATAAATAAITETVDTAVAEVEMMISDVATGVLGAVAAVTPGKQMCVAQKQMGTNANPAHYFTNPLWGGASVRLITFGAMASGNIRWCDMVSVSTLGDWERYVMSNDPLVAMPASPSILGSYAQPKTHVMVLPFVSTRVELHPVLTQVATVVAAEQAAAAAVVTETTSLLAADDHARGFAPAIPPKPLPEDPITPPPAPPEAPATPAPPEAPAAPAPPEAPETPAPETPAPAPAPEAPAPVPAPTVSAGTVIANLIALNILAVTTVFSNIWTSTVMYTVERNPVMQWKLKTDARAGLVAGTVRAHEVTGNTIAHYESGLAAFDV